jgi:hypothetical protein
MIKDLAMECMRNLSFFPVKGGVSKYCSATEMSHQQKLDFCTQCNTAQFGYVHHEPNPSNSLAQCFLDCIYLSPLSDVQGKHDLFHPATRQTFTQPTATVSPMPTSVVKAVNDLAAAEGMKGLEMKTNLGTF